LKTVRNWNPVGGVIGNAVVVLFWLFPTPPTPPDLLTALTAENPGGVLTILLLPVTAPKGARLIGVMAGSPKDDIVRVRYLLAGW
jgi:hypothetical protein